MPDFVPKLMQPRSGLSFTAPLSQTNSCCLISVGGDGLLLEINQNKNQSESQPFSNILGQSLIQNFYCIFATQDVLFTDLH